MRIGLNAGHTIKGAGGGAVGVLNESAETRRVAAELTRMFQAAGCEVVDCTIDEATSQSAYLAAAVNAANRYELDWFISIHFNNDSARKGQGVEAYTYEGRQYPDAVEVCEHIAALGFRNRGVKKGSGLYVIRKTRAKALLIEVCFVNEPDASLYRQKFDDVCRAIAYAMADYVAPAAPAAPQIPVPAPSVLPSKKQYVKVIVPELSVRKSASWDDSAVCGTVRRNEVFTIAEGPIEVGNGRMYRLKSGLYITAADKYVLVYEK